MTRESKLRLTHEERTKILVSAEELFDHIDQQTDQITVLMGYAVNDIQRYRRRSKEAFNLRIDILDSNLILVADLDLDQLGRLGAVNAIELLRRKASDARLYLQLTPGAASVLTARCRCFLSVPTCHHVRSFPRCTGYYDADNSTMSEKGADL